MKKIIGLMIAAVILCMVGERLLFAEETGPASDAAAPAPTPKEQVKSKTKAVKKKKTGKINKEAAAPSNAKTEAVSGQKSIQATTPAPRSAQLEAWLKKIKDRLAKVQTKNNRLVAVAAVRGAEAKDAPPLYWKGLSTESSVNETEVAEFQGAVDEASNGKSEEAEKKFQSFLSAHPKSPMTEDAQNGLDLLKGNSVKPN